MYRGRVGSRLISSVMALLAPSGLDWIAPNQISQHPKLVEPFDNRMPLNQCIAEAVYIRGASADWSFVANRHSACNDGLGLVLHVYYPPAPQQFHL